MAAERNTGLKEVALSVAVANGATGYLPDLFGITSQSHFLDMEMTSYKTCSAIWHLLQKRADFRL